MKLQLTPSFKRSLYATLFTLLMDVFDGQIGTPQVFVQTLRNLADEIEEQNKND